MRIIMATKAQSWITPRLRSGLRLSCSNYAQRLQQIGSPKSPLKPLQGLLRSQGDHVLTVPVTRTTTASDISVVPLTQGPGPEALTSTSGRH